MVRFICFGDSNTWGYISGSNRKRYNENERWTKLLQKSLGDGYEIIEEGLNSRTMFTEGDKKSKSDGREKPGRIGYDYLLPCMDTHDKFDAVILMLGTNELQDKLGNSASDIVKMIDRYAKAIMGYQSQIDGKNPKLVVLGAPIISEEVSKVKTDKFFNTHEKSIEYAELLKKYCAQKSIDFVDTSDLLCGVDGVHLTKESHRLLAERLSKLIKAKWQPM